MLAVRARGVRRDRIADPILRIRPVVVAISAPSGYGKTVVAAQLAQSMPSVFWTTFTGANTERASALDQLMLAMGEPPKNGRRSSPQRLADRLSRLLPDEAETPVALVFDDASGLEADHWAAILDLAEALPATSMLIVATREPCPYALPSGVWGVTAADLILSDREILQLWRAYFEADADASQVALLRNYSAGQAAMAALVLKNWRADEPSTTTLSNDTRRLVQSLVSAQLDSRERRVLHAAAVLREGATATLGRCTGDQEYEGRLRRVAEVLPLVRVADSRQPGAFSVHQLVEEALSSAAELASSDPASLRCCVDELLRRGRGLRALEVAASARDESLNEYCLSQSGEDLVSTGHEARIREAIEALSPSTLIESPALLLLKAASLWERNEVADAVRVAEIARRLSEHSGDEVSLVKARLALARMRASVGDYRGALDESAAMMRAPRTACDPDDLASAVSSAVLASTFAADRNGLAHALDCGGNVLHGAELDGQSGARLSVCQGISAGLLDGNWRAATQHFRKACQYAAGPVLGAVCHGNLGGACLEIGDLEAAEKALETSRELAHGAEFHMLLDSTALTSDVVRSVSCPDTEIESSALRVVAQSEQVGDAVTAVCALLYAACSAFMCRRAVEAARLSEHALQLAQEAGSPLLVWHAQVAQAEGAAAVGDISWSQSIIGSLEPSLAAAGASGLLLRTRLVTCHAESVSGARPARPDELALSRDYVSACWPLLGLASHVRAFPSCLAAVVTRLGTCAYRGALLRLIPDPYATEALEACVGRLPREDIDALSVRMLGRPFDREVHASAGSAAQPAPACSVRLFGGFEVRTPGGPVPDKAWVKRKARLMFAMLAARPGKDVPREQIIDYLWPDMDEQRGLNNFYVAWSSMKRALSPGAGRDEACPYVEHVRGVCRLVTAAVTSDLIELESNLAIARKARSAGDTDSELAALQAVADLYRGELLPGDSYDDWFSSLRERCRHDFEDAMLRSAEILEARGELQAALGLLRRALTHDPWREDLYQSALRLQIAAGQRSAAIETYMLCRTRLVEDLGIDPSGETTRLYEHVLGMEA